jgi:hypothetical protein
MMNDCGRPRIDELRYAELLLQPLVGVVIIRTTFQYGRSAWGCDPSKGDDDSNDITVVHADT